MNFFVMPLGALLAEVPNNSNFFCSLYTTMSHEQVAHLYGSLGWKVRKCTWVDYEVTCNWADLVIESESPVLVHGPVADLLSNVDRILAPLREAGVDYSAECFSEAGELLRNIEWAAA